MAESCNNGDEDVVERILSVLPPKTLMRFKCVSKRWYGLITNPRFVAMHLSNSVNNNLSTTCVLLKRLVHKGTNTTSGTQEAFSLLKFRNDIDNGGEHEHSFLSGVEDIEIPLSMSLEASTDSLQIVGHCDGIICLADLTGQMFLWNPAIQECKLLPPKPNLQEPPRYRFFLFDSMAFGYDPNSKGYKVVNIGFPYPMDKEIEDNGYYIYHPPKVVLYTHLGTDSDSWREIKTSSLETQTTILWPETFQMYFKDVCYWIGREQHKELHGFEAGRRNSLRT